MNLSARSRTEQRLMDYVHSRELGNPDTVPTAELTSILHYAIDEKLPRTLTAALREVGRRGGFVVSVHPLRQV